MTDENQTLAIILFSIVAIGVSGAIASGCSSNRENKELKQQIENLQKANGNN